VARLRIGFRPSTTGVSSAPFDRIRKRLPLAPTVTRDIANRVMRQGRGSVAEQRRRQATQGPTGAETPWKRTGDFGKVRAPARTLHRSGSLDQQWAGVGPGAITRATSTKVEIGVTGYGALFQRRAAWVVKAKRLARGDRRLAMQIYLGLAKAAWISEAKLRRGLRNVPRRVGISRHMLRRTGDVVIRYLQSGRIKVDP
jgi:hypothetical protein